MKKQGILLLAIILTLCAISPSAATVFLHCADLGNGVVELRYDSTEEAVPVRAFSLDISVSNGIILSIGNLNPDYWIYPGSFSRYVFIDAETGEIEEVLPGYTPIAPSDDPGALGGLGTDGMTIEMGALYPPEANAPGPTGVLCTFTVSAGCDVIVVGNAIRGGVVLEDATEADVHSPGLSGVSAPTGGVYGGGTGTLEDPYLISTAEQMNAIGINPVDWHRHFKLMADIDVGAYSETDFNIIGGDPNKPFMGVFDGNNHTIYNFTYTCQDSDFIGLFGCVYGEYAEIKNLHLIAPNVEATTGSNVGSLVGCLQWGSITACCAAGGSVSGGDCVGGLVGRHFGGEISDCYARADVFADHDAGGLVGRGYREISNCYSAGHVPQDANKVGGLIGYNHGVISDSFWDAERSGQADGAGGTGQAAVSEVTGKTTEQMRTADTFIAAGWDFEGESANGTEDIWTIREGETYPRFVRQQIQGDFVGREGVDSSDLAFFAVWWMEDECAASNDCSGIDLDRSGRVDAGDLRMFLDYWLVGVD